MSTYGADTSRDSSDLYSTVEIGEFNEGGFRAFEPPEESLPHVIRHMNAGRSWDWLMGIVAILQNTTEGMSHNEEQITKDPDSDLQSNAPLWQSGSPGEGWEAAMGLPTLEHMVEMMRGVEAAYVQGLSSTPMQMDKDNLNEYFADVIVDREADAVAIMNAYEAGTLTLTPLEEEAYALAQEWAELVRNGEKLPADALGDAYSDYIYKNPDLAQVDVGEAFEDVSFDLSDYSGPDASGDVPKAVSSDASGNFDMLGISQIAFIGALGYAGYQAYLYSQR